MRCADYRGNRSQVWTEFIATAAPIRQQVSALLHEGAGYDIAPREKTPLAKTVRTCQQLLNVESALWRFVTTKGIEPTNNAAICQKLAAGSAHVVVNYASSPEAANQLADQIQAAGGKAITIEANMNDAAQIMNLFEEAESRRNH